MLPTGNGYHVIVMRVTRYLVVGLIRTGERDSGARRRRKQMSDVGSARKFPPGISDQ
jgi:hypothetical protein